MADTRSTTHTDDELDAAIALDRGQLVDERQDGGFAAVEDALPADRDEGDIREDLQVALAVGLGQHAAILQRFAHVARVDMGAAIAADELAHVRSTMMGLQLSPKTKTAPCQAPWGQLGDSLSSGA